MQQKFEEIINEHFFQNIERNCCHISNNWSVFETLNIIMFFFKSFFLMKKGEYNFFRCGIKFFLCWGSLTMANTFWKIRIGSYASTMTSHLWESRIRKFWFPTGIHLEWVSIIHERSEGRRETHERCIGGNENFIMRIPESVTS